MASASAATQLADWTDSEGATYKVPPNVLAALETKYRGQGNLGKTSDKILAFFVEAPETMMRRWCDGDESMI